MDTDIVILQAEPLLFLPDTDLLPSAYESQTDPTMQLGSKEISNLLSVDELLDAVSFLLIRWMAGRQPL